MDFRQRNKFTEKYYVLEILENGCWREVDTVTPANASARARGGTKKLKVKHRVVDRKGNVIIETDVL